MWRLCLLFACSSLAHSADLLPDVKQPITRHNPQSVTYAETLFYLHSGNYDAALTKTYELRQNGGRGYGRELDIYEAAAQLGLGMDQHASRVFNQLLKSEKMSLIPLPARAQAWFYLAKHLYTKGWWQSGLKAVKHININHLSPELKDEYHFLAATLELFVGRPEAADRHLLAINSESKWATYGFLNLAVSYTERDVHISKVDAAFSKALQLSTQVESHDILSDRINLMAGRFFYATGRGRSAIKHLKAVNLDGPYTPKALLTYGWALTEQWQYHDALQPWYMLKTAHSPLNQDVQETLIAIPFLLEKLNAKVMALGAFEYAVDQYDRVYEQLSESADRLNTGKFIEPLLAQQSPNQWGAFIPVDLSLPKHPDQFYLKDVMADSYFQGELKNLRDLHVMRNKLNKALSDLEAFAVTKQTRQQEYKEIHQQNTMRMLTSRLSKLRLRYQSLQKKIRQAFGKPDGSGLATNEEKRFLEMFKKVNTRRSALETDQHYQQRLRRVKGLLSWNLSERYAARKQNIAENLAGLKQQMRSIENQIKATQYAYQIAPRSYQGFDSKIAVLKQKYTTQLAKLERTYRKQREQVGSIVKADIKKRQEKVVEYQLQARLASARLFDETSNKSRNEAVAEVKQ
ncbi:hypothetical protein HF888_06080 [Bermanella marisrubri]|uniref:Protein containing tetratricopeptide repeats n=1 Tax=Bermanella marisrubri TaxID=207949 RepID=Q1N0Q2_9GAMM|nr:hypothetical protein [Bermanella marisrubri]EAT11781.1 protein containing tetratricopeptide repeats [Oceanobacter sp. RED65] [Bermanella marisrubri]QIZ83816.1 hypothetical protein HF888_06080 [Bermanella marisrubri]